MDCKNRTQMTGLNGDNKVNDFTQVSNSASARSGAGFRGVRFYISLKPLKFSPYNLEADIHIGFKQRIPILHHSEKVQKKIILHRSQTRWSSRVSTFVLEVDRFTQVSNVINIFGNVLLVCCFTQDSNPVEFEGLDIRFRSGPFYIGLNSRRSEKESEEEFWRY